MIIWLHGIPQWSAPGPLLSIICMHVFLNVLNYYYHFFLPMNIKLYSFKMSILLNHKGLYWYTMRMVHWNISWYFWNVPLYFWSVLCLLKYHENVPWYISNISWSFANEPYGTLTMYHDTFCYFIYFQFNNCKTYHIFDFLLDVYVATKITVTTTIHHHWYFFTG